jgi:hypothetical protein
MLNVGLDVSFCNTYDWKRILEKPREVNVTKVYIKNYKLPSEFSTDVTLVVTENKNPRFDENARFDVLAMPTHILIYNAYGWV